MPKRRKPNEDAAEQMAEQPRRKDLPPCQYYLGTGSTILDLAISDRYPGGVGGGRITHFYGDASTAKTVIVQQILGAAQRQKGYAIIEDAEYTLDFGRALLFGLRTGNWDEETQIEYEGTKLAKAVKADGHFAYRIPITIEGLFDDEIGEALKLMEENRLPPVTAMGVDSLTALPSMTETKEDLDKPGYDMSRAKMFSKAFRKYIGRMAKLGLSVVVIDQTREAVGVQFGPKHTTSGGKAKTFYSSTRVLLQKGGNIVNKYDQVVGVYIKFRVEKNKIAPPFREGQFRLIFDYGVDDLGSNLEWLKEHRILTEEEQADRDGLVAEYDGKISKASRGDKRQLRAEKKKALEKLDKKAGWWEFGGVKKQSLAALLEWVEANDQEEKVRAEVARVWRAIHQPTTRKPRYGEA